MARRRNRERVYDYILRLVENMGEIENPRKLQRTVKLPSGERAPTAEVIEALIRQREVNERIDQIAARFSAREFTVRGLDGDFGTVADQGDRFQFYRYRADIGQMTADQLHNYLSRLNEWTDDAFYEMDERWRQNTITAIIDVHGVRSSRRLVNWIQNMSIEQFIEIMYTNDVSIEYVYTDEGRDGALEELAAYFGLNL